MMLRIGLVALSVGALFGQQESPRERELQARVDSLEKRLADVEAKLLALAGVASVTPKAVEPGAAVAPAAPVPKEPPPATTSVAASVVPDTTFNATVDGYYAFNFNRPYPRENQLRGYDQSHNSFSLNQATIVLERAPNVAEGRRWGGRVDLQFGQATQTLQGSAANENRPEIYRALFQAYGSYILPVGSGLQADFGKFASSLGYEGNFTKDQMNYSRSFWFNYLPFYHFGFRTTYSFGPKLTAQYWLVNGANQSEDFNGFKSQAFQLVMRPAKSVAWTANYFYGQEARQADANLPPTGRSHIFDTYVVWTPANSKWTAVLEGDYTVNRSLATDAPGRVNGGAAYLQYQATPKVAFAGRFELLQDRSGFFSGRTQTLKELTLTGTRSFGDGFQAKVEYRRDFSNAAYFNAGSPLDLRRHQDTATLGLIWWFGGKQGSW